MKPTKIFQGMAFGIILGALSLSGRAAATHNDNDAGEGAVYVLTNQASGNTVVALRRAEDGTLIRVQEVSTGGLGSGPGITPPPLPPGPGPDPLQSQDALIASADGHFLLAVNAGSNDISVLAITRQGLQLTDRISAGGVFPISVAIRKNLVYVLNEGGPSFSPDTFPGEIPSVTGFLLGFTGKLLMIPNSARSLGSFVGHPSDVVISPDGELLLVPETFANVMHVFHLGEDGRTGVHDILPSNSPTPAAFAFGHHQLIAVTEVNTVSSAGGRRFAPNAASVSTYRITDENTLQSVSISVPNHQTATCWIRFTPNGRFLYTVDSGTGTISAYQVSPKGEISLLPSTNIGGIRTGSIDFDITADGRFLYVVSAFIGTVQGFRIEKDGSLTPVLRLAGFPISTQGIVAR